MRPVNYSTSITIENDHDAYVASLYRLFAALAAGNNSYSQAHCKDCQLQWMSPEPLPHSQELYKGASERS
jgi:hypothetical protein